MICSFPPIVNNSTEILILGTMPGATSLEKQEYYAYKQNHFWKIIYTLFGTFPISDIFEEKVKLLLQNNIGLWDVLQNCEREGSLDTNIRNHQENDFSTLFTEYPGITTLVFNGKESHKYFTKKFGQLPGITYHVMPSTSPANTMKFDTKLEIWKEVFVNDNC